MWKWLFRGPGRLLLWLALLGLVCLGAAAHRGSGPLAPLLTWLDGRAEASARGFLTYPFLWNEDMRLVAGWQYSDGTYHGGIDFVKGTAGYRQGWQSFEVLAAAPGEACWSAGSGNDPGYTVNIRHTLDATVFETEYVHLKGVEKGLPHCPERVPVGRASRIGAAGDKGWRKQCPPPCVHLHFQVMLNGRVLDPYDLYGPPPRYPQPNGARAGLMGPNYEWSADPPPHPNEDRIPPAIHFSLPRLNTWYVTDERIAWQITDEGGSGVKGFSAAWDRDPGDLPPALWGDAGSVTLSEIGVGVHTLSVRAWDNRDNEVFLTQGWVGYDPFPPTSPLSARERHGVLSDVTQDALDDPAFTWDKSEDRISGIAGYNVYWGISPTGTAANWAQGGEYDPGPVRPGVYYLRVSAVDGAGNQGPWHTVFIFRYKQ